MSKYDLVLLLGGTGSRMGIKGDDNKSLTEIQGRPIIEHIKEKIDTYEKAVQPFANKYIVTNGKGVGEIMKTFGQNYTYFFQESPSGIPDAAYIPRPQNPFLLHLGDQFYQDQIGQFIQGFAESEEKMRVWLKETNDHNHTVASFNGDGKLKKFIEKPSYPKEMTSYVATGMYMLQPYLSKVVPLLPRRDKGENNMSDLGNLVLSQERKIGTKQMNGYWTDINSKQFLDIAERYK